MLCSYLGGTLSKVCPLFRLVEEAKLASSLCAPYYTGGGTGGVKASVGKVTSVTNICLALFLLVESNDSLAKEFAYS